MVLRWSTFLDPIELRSTWLIPNMQKQVQIPLPIKILRCFNLAYQEYGSEGGSPVRVAVVIPNKMLTEA